MEDQTRVLDEKRKITLGRIRMLYAVMTYAAAILALLSLIGIIVCIFMLNFGTRSEQKDFILYVLAGAFAGGAALMALFTYLCSKLMSAASERELDYRERLDGEESFFVGEGTLLTFGEEGITVHSEVPGKNNPVFVPYAETRYISICTRRRPQERGSWCVAIEIPVKYLSKNREEKSDEKLLVQADAKARLYKALEKHNLTLLGEERKEGENKKFTPVKTFVLPNRKKRKIALITLGVGVLCAGGSIPLGIFAAPTFGALLGAVGLVLVVRASFSFFRAKAVFGVYNEGIFWRESSGVERLFLKWEDIQRVVPEEKNGYPVLTFSCDYGRYAIPAVAGAYECIEGFKEEKCSKNK